MGRRLLASATPIGRRSRLCADSSYAPVHIRNDRADHSFLSNGAWTDFRPFDPGRGAAWYTAAHCEVSVVIACPRRAACRRGAGCRATSVPA